MEYNHHFVVGLAMMIMWMMGFAIGRESNK